MNNIFLLFVFCFKKGGSKTRGKQNEVRLLLNAATPITNKKID